MCSWAPTGGVDCQFMFDSSDEHARWPWKCFRKPIPTRAEVYFGDYRESEGHFLPYRFEVRYGDTTFNIFNVAKYDLLQKESGK